MQGPNQALRHFLILHFTSLHFTSLHFTSLHFTSLHFTLLHFTSLYFTLLHFTSLYFTLLHFTSLHFTSLPFTNFTDDIFWLKTSILFFVVQDNFILRFGTRLPTTIFCILIIYLRFFYKSLRTWDYTRLALVQTVAKKKRFFLLNDALATAILNFISRVHLASFVITLPKYLKYSTFSGCTVLWGGGSPWHSHSVNHFY